MNGVSGPGLIIAIAIAIAISGGSQACQDRRQRIGSLASRASATG